MGHDIKSEFKKTVTNISNFELSKVHGGTLKAIYGSAGDVVLFWAHHEKLLVIDRKLGFMGGLDMCMYISVSGPLTDMSRLWEMGHK